MPGVSKNSSSPLDAGDVVMSLHGGLELFSWQVAVAAATGATAGAVAEAQPLAAIPLLPLEHSSGRKERASDCMACQSIFSLFSG